MCCRSRRGSQRKRGREARGDVAAVPVGGGRARVGLEIDHSEPLGSRVAISRAGRRPPAHRAATESKTCACVARRSGGGVPSEARWYGGCGAGGHGRPIGGWREACRAWPGFEATRRAKLAAWTVSGRAGPAPHGGLAGCAIVAPATGRCAGSYACVLWPAACTTLEGSS